jgi:RNA polymerase sigma-70 factor (ECF subfamily)
MDEAALIQDAQRGDVDAYNTLVLHYQSQAYNVAYRIMGESSSAADATQEAFISAFKNIRRFRGGSFRAWLLRIVTNACYDELRRLKRRPQTSLEALLVEDEAPDSPFTSQSESPEHHAQQMELQRAIEDCLRGLSEEHRLVAILADVEGYSYIEIAQVSDCAVGTVKSRLSRARAQMRDCLTGFRELLPSAYRLRSEGDR